MEKCLVFLKPDAVLRKCVGAAILKDFLQTQEKFKILGIKEVQVNEQLARKHYAEHEGKAFFPWLIKSLCSAPVLAMIIEGHIENIREFLGATFVQKAAPDTIRGKYGIWGGVNSVHASDSIETANRELKLWQKTTGLEDEHDVEKKVKRIIKEWCNNEIGTGNTFKIRELCRKLAENKLTKDEIFSQLTVLLTEDCPQSDQQTIMKFTEIIIENILL
ncbi:MAG: nucleoside-diphosphate kinase [Candidatus Helarchaeota archaeon]